MTDRPDNTIELGELESLVPGPTLGPVVPAGRGSFASAFDVDHVVFTAAAAVNAAFGERTLDLRRAVALCAGRALVAGEPVPVWSDLSGYYETSGGGHIQFHCNFPHHAAGVVAELGCDPTRESIQAAVLRRDAQELESALIGQGMIAARLRTLDEWRAHPHAVATAALPLISVERIGDGPPRSVDRRRRVLDCSRIIAGPVAGQVFASRGADVLRIGSQHLPSVDIGVLTTGSGKRNAFVELDTSAGVATMRGLLDDVDVWVDAYRPGGFEGHGFSLDTVAPGSVTVQVSAFDWVGPWAGRRGFDSIVQSTTGIVRAGSEAAGTTEPTPLPVQALDYCTGLLAAFAGERLVQHQSEVGGTWLARLSLLRTRNWLVGRAAPKPFTPASPEVSPDAMQTTTTPFGEVTTARPLAGSWPHGPQPLGSSAPVWQGER
ncbi:MAG: CoA transferase [Acidimicrobiales bacterium]|nr:CoA transferase [Acidimicrobiia bacterium]NNC80629.1 CoA transferase [Acidimicrobiales bacterium]RZV47712.1 MAG: CoA transferase [Acidimicrobiales bacterium]